MKHSLFYVATVFAVLFTSCSDHHSYDATGTFEATQITVSAEVSGKIIRMDVEEGQLLRAGDMIGQIDTTMLYLRSRQLMSQQSALLNSKPDVNKQVASLRRQIDKQQREVKRVENLLKGNAATQKQFDDAQTQWSVLQGQLDATLASLKSNSASIDQNAAAAEWQLKQIAYDIARCRITMPADGTVLVKYVEAGEMAVAGRPLVKIADLNKMYLRAYFTSDQLSSICLGQHVTVTADFGGDEQHVYDGVVTWISAESEFTPKGIQTRSSRANLVYAVKIAVANDGRIKSGLYGEVTL